MMIIQEERGWPGPGHARLARPGHVAGTAASSPFHRGHGRRACR